MTAGQADNGLWGRSECDMAGHLNQVRDDPAALLLYLSGELDQAERQAVEARLSREPQLATTLEELRQLDAQARGCFAEDRTAPADELLVKRLVREMKRHRTELALRPTAAPARPTRRHWPWYAQAAAAVAAAFFIFLGLWSFGIIDGNPTLQPVQPPVAIDPNAEKTISTDALLVLLEQSLSGAHEETDLQLPEGPPESLNDLLL